MYKIRITLLLFVWISMATAQSFQGKAYYQTKRDFEMKMDTTQVNNTMQKQIFSMLTKEFEKNYILTFNKEASIYKQEDKLDAPKPQSGIMISNNGGFSVLYKNIKTQRYVKKQEHFGKKFLIQDEIPPLKWKHTKETKMIGKYLCLKATTIKITNDYDDDLKKEIKKEKTVVAWYTPEIPVSNGPEYYGGLSGLILELHEDKMHYVCHKIVMNPKAKIEISAPTRGERINQKDYDAVMKNHQEKMLKSFQSGRKKGENSKRIIFSIGG